MSALYIYYRVQPDCADALAAAVREMQARLRGLMPGLSATLLQRVDDAGREPAAANPELTWMETYHFNGHADRRAWSAFDDALALHVQALPRGITGPRHAERFAPLGSAVPAGRRTGGG